MALNAPFQTGGIGSDAAGFSFMLERQVAPPAKIFVLLPLPVTRKALSRQLALPSPPLLSVQAATWFGSFLSTYGGMVGIERPVWPRLLKQVPHSHLVLS
ncbi:MAG: hypothetical protein DME22_07915 [Verrucomicrobia bacterium]|nr:MAG: hypothetical protein DME22_07915 [Verrucomicrobiota bacterium]